MLSTSSIAIKEVSSTEPIPFRNGLSPFPNGEFSCLSESVMNALIPPNRYIAVELFEGLTVLVRAAVDPPFSQLTCVLFVLSGIGS